MIDPALFVALAAVVAAPIVSLWIASRKMSGRIGTSDASELWAASKALRDEYREQLNKMSTRQRDLEGRVASLEGENTVLSRGNYERDQKIAVLELTIAKLRETIASLESTIRSQKEELEK
jgi:peptidoglycan hydrolase CwlO-like protein